jgi:putative ABC transport system substrate-binding protein
VNRRRKLLLLAGASVLARPLGAGAQQARKLPPRIGFIGNPDPNTWDSVVAAFRQGLRELGWIEGKTISIEYRWAEGKIDRFPLIAAELVRLNVDVIVVAGSPSLKAAQQATSTIPIIMGALLIDPVDAGFVASLARPGGNISGLASQYEEIITKQVQLLAEAVPKLSRLVILRHASASTVTENAAAKAADKLGLKTQVLTVGEIADLEVTFKAARDSRSQAILVLPSPILGAHRHSLIKLAARYRLPACYEFKEFVQIGGLLSYGASIPDMFRRAASFVDRVLKGAKPGDLPIERPEKFELAINLGTAKALGLEIPMSLLTRADQLIH